jgi:diguanylate cyclase (GGDEF)-like protein
MEAPIRSDDRVYGILGAYSPEARKFSADDLSFLTSLANVIGASLLRTRAEERAARLAQFDALTDLPNRVLFNDRAGIALAQARRAGTSVALIFLDLDRFKAVNDSLGHAVGDALLRDVAARLNASVRGSDTVCRHGGDEFVILMAGIADEKDAARIAEKVTQTISRPFTIEGTELVVTCSIGVACYPADGEGLDVLLRNADAAMYAAKATGRNGYQFYSADMNRRAHERR